MTSSGTLRSSKQRRASFTASANLNFNYNSQNKKIVESYQEIFKYTSKNQVVGASVGCRDCFATLGTFVKFEAVIKSRILSWLSSLGSRGPAVWVDRFLVSVGGGFSTNATLKATGTVDYEKEVRKNFVTKVQGDHNCWVNWTDPILDGHQFPS